MIIPELPAYLTSLGGAEYKGLIISLFTLTAGLSRPFSGKLADTIGRKPVMIVGTIVCIICSLLYPLIGGVTSFLLLRFFHGFSTGFSPTAITAIVADIVPDHRRGEAMGIIGLSINLGSSITPPIGSHLATTFSLDIMFMASSVCALISMLLILFLKETLPNKKSFRLADMRLKKEEIIDKNSLLPAVICGSAYMGFGALITITPDQCDFFELNNKGLFFTSFTICSVLARLFAGRLSDIYGRIIVMRIAVVLLSLSYILIGLSSSSTWLLIGSGAIGFSLGIAIPGLFAWTIDRSSGDNRGKAIATLFIGLEVAIGSGALIGAAVYDNNPLNYGIVFFIMGGVSLIGLLFLRKSKVNNN